MYNFSKSFNKLLNTNIIMIIKCARNFILYFINLIVKIILKTKLLFLSFSLLHITKISSFKMTVELYYYYNKIQLWAKKRVYQLQGHLHIRQKKKISFCLMFLHPVICGRPSTLTKIDILYLHNLGEKITKCIEYEVCCENQCNFSLNLLRTSLNLSTRRVKV